MALAPVNNFSRRVLWRIYTVPLCSEQKQRNTINGNHVCCIYRGRYSTFLSLLYQNEPGRVLYDTGRMVFWDPWSRSRSSHPQEKTRDFPNANEAFDGAIRAQKRGKQVKKVTKIMPPSK
mmetsp:Transcript_27702/g.64184  ORF Transcript_27702/g.64184 Transcript_27702/m.64184 type:complete len:120 (-) Transcript_27702:711-1070(-)